MKSSIPLRIKILEIAKGFFGWLIISNLVYFFLSISLGLFVQYKDYLLFIYILSTIIWLSAIITSVFLYFKKKTRAFVGVLMAFVINGGLLNALNLGNPSISSGNIFLLMGFPIPAFIIPLMFMGQ